MFDVRYIDKRNLVCNQNSHWYPTSIHFYSLNITGLDPAKPYFDLVPKERGIMKTDGELVDIVHTNSGFLWEVYLKH